MKKGFLIILASFFVTAAKAQVIYTIAGTGVNGYSGDGGPAISACLSGAGSVCYDRKGNLYFVDLYRIRKITPSGIISTVAGSGAYGHGGDGGAAIYAQIDDASGIVIDSIGNLLIAAHDQSEIRKVDTFGIITSIIGNHGMGYSGDGGPASDARINQPASVAFNSHGELFIGDYNHVIRKVDASGIITTYAGNGTSGYGGDGGPAMAASFTQPAWLAFDKYDNLFISDYPTNRIRRIDATTSIITTVVGGSTLGYGGDGGPASAALIHTPGAIVVDTGGVLYFSDNFNSRIRKIEGGIITTVAGTGIEGFSGDGGNSTHAQIHASGGLVFDKNSNLVFTDYYRIRIIKTGGDGVDVEERKQENVSIYPNPCDGHFMLHIEGVSLTLDKVEIIISNVVGDIVSRLEATGKRDLAINLDHVPGIYLVKTITSSGTTVCKVVVE